MRRTTRRTGSRITSAGFGAAVAVLGMVSAAWACAPLTGEDVEMDALLTAGQQTASATMQTWYDTTNDEFNGVTGPHNLADLQKAVAFQTVGVGRIAYNQGEPDYTKTASLWLAKNPGGSLYYGVTNETLCKADPTIADSVGTYAMTNKVGSTTTSWHLEGSGAWAANTRTAAGRYLVCAGQWPQFFKTFITIA